MADTMKLSDTMTNGEKVDPSLPDVLKPIEITKTTEQKEILTLRQLLNSLDGFDYQISRLEAGKKDTQARIDNIMATLGLTLETPPPIEGGDPLRG